MLGDGGADLDPTPNTMTIDVTPVNDAPSGTDNTVTLNEEEAFTFAVADFGFSDVADGDLLSAVVITTLPAAGSLTLDGDAVLAGQAVSADDIAAAKKIKPDIASVFDQSGVK